MNIRTATKIAIAGIAIALLMSLCSGMLISWMVQRGDMTSAGIGRLQMAYFSTQAVIHYGGLLVFFLTLLSRQKEQAS